MQALDTNVLIYAEIESSKYHGPARKVLKNLAEGTVPWAIPWPCIYEFLRVVTHPRVFHPPVPLDIVLKDLEQLLASPSLLSACGNGTARFRARPRASPGGRHRQFDP